MSQQAVQRPVPKGNLHDEDRLNPGDSLTMGRGWQRVEAARPLLQRPQQGAKTVQLSLAETRADAAGVPPCVLDAVADKQRTYLTVPAAFARCPSPYDEFLSATDLDLCPVRGSSPRLVSTRKPFCHHTLKTEVCGGLKELSTSPNMMGGYREMRAGRNDLCEQATTVFIRQASCINAVECEQIE